MSTTFNRGTGQPQPVQDALHILERSSLGCVQLTNLLGVKGDADGFFSYEFRHEYRLACAPEKRRPTHRVLYTN